MAFGLIGLLVTIGVIVMIMNTVLKKEQTVISAGNKARDEVKQFGARSEDMTPAQNSVTFEEQQTGGRFEALRVTSVVPGGAMDKFYGLRANDVIVEVNGMRMRDLAPNDPDLGQSLVIDAFTKSQPITVLRNGQQTTLPRPAGAQTATPDPAAPAQPQPPEQNTDPLQRQLDAIQKVPTH
jgi:S1-C subfamily serine protease